MSDTKGPGGDLPDHEGRHDLGGIQTHGPEPDVPVDPALENRGPHHVSGITVPIFNAPTGPFEETTASNSGFNSSLNNTHQAVASLDFSNEPFESDQAQQEWLRATIGDYHLVDEHQSASENHLQSEAARNSNTMRQELNNPATLAGTDVTIDHPHRPTELATLEVSHDQAPNHKPFSISDANQLIDNNSIQMIPPSSAAPHNSATITAEARQRDNGHDDEAQPRAIQSTQADTVPQNASKDSQHAPSSLGRRPPSRGEAPSTHQGISGRNGSVASSQAGLMSGVSLQRPGVEAFYRRTCAYIGFSYHDTKRGMRMLGQTYVEKLEPLRKHCDTPLVLVHGDFHTSQVSSSQKKRYLRRQKC